MTHWWDDLDDEQIAHELVRRDANRRAASESDPFATPITIDLARLLVRHVLRTLDRGRTRC